MGLIAASNLAIMVFTASRPLRMLDVWMDALSENIGDCNCVTADCHREVLPHHATDDVALYKRPSKLLLLLLPV